MNKLSRDCKLNLVSQSCRSEFFNRLAHAGQRERWHLPRGFGVTQFGGYREFLLVKLFDHAAPSKHALARDVQPSTTATDRASA
jgi:hypothetical protein